MGFHIPQEEYDRWVRQGLVPGPVPTAQARAKKEKRELVEPVFVVPGTWVVPLHLEPMLNGPAVKKQMIGRAGRDRRVVARSLAMGLFSLARMYEYILTGHCIRCRIVRLAKGNLDDDNLQAAAKYVRDTVALFLGQDDGPAGPIRWEYGQEQSAKSGVRIELSLEAK